MKYTCILCVWKLVCVYAYLNAPALLKFVVAMPSVWVKLMLAYVYVCIYVRVCLLSLFVVVHYMNFCCLQNSTSWVLSNLAALYWRVVGQGQLAIKCLKHSLYYSNEYTRVSLPTPTLEFVLCRICPYYYVGQNSVFWAYCQSCSLYALHKCVTPRLRPWWIDCQFKLLLLGVGMYRSVLFTCACFVKLQYRVN